MTLRELISAVHAVYVASTSEAAPQVVSVKAPRTATQALERVRLQVTEAIDEETRTKALWSRLVVLAAVSSGLEADHAFVAIRGYMDWIPRSLSTLQKAIDESAPGAPAQRVVDAAASAFLSASTIPGESGIIALFGKAYIFWEFLLASDGDRQAFGPDLLTAHQVVATFIGLELKGQHDRAAASLMKSVAVGPASEARGVATDSSAANPDETVAEAELDNTAEVADGPTAPDVAQTFEEEAPVRREQPRTRLDTTFGDGGVALGTFPAPATCRALLAQPDGCIVLAGIVNDIHGEDLQPRNFGLIRLDPDGMPDRRFGRDGYIDLDIEGADCAAYAVALQEDLKIVIAGEILDHASGRLNFAVVRLDADGQMDSAFQGGVVVTDFVLGSAGVRALGVQQDRKIIAAGDAWYPTDVSAGLKGGESSTSAFALARYEADGTLDVRFGSKGRTTTLMASPGGLATVRALHIQADGRILAAGHAERHTHGEMRPKVAVARYAPDGSLDKTFGSDGYAMIDVADRCKAYSLAVQPDDGSIILAGEAYYPSTGRRFLLIRLDPTGKLDPRFAGMNRVLNQGLYGGLFGVAILPDARILAAGFATPQTPEKDERKPKIALACYLRDGSFDASFGTGGVLLIDPGGDSSGAYGIALANGQILVGGDNRIGEESDFVVAKVEAPAVAPTTKARGAAARTPMSGGQVDRSFAGLGAAFAPFSTSATARTICIQTDGRMVVAGDADAGVDPPSRDFAVIRLEPDGTIDEGFGNRGLALIGFSDSDDRAYAVQVQQDGKIAVVGESHDRKTDARDLLAVRLTPTGKRDTEFSEDGVMLSPGFFGAGAPASSGVVCVQADGTILAAGAGASGHLRLARYASDGSQDRHFGTDGTASAAIADSEVQPRAMAIQPDGKIVLVASVRSAGERSPRDFAVARFNSDGTIDRSFGVDGWTIIDLHETDPKPHAVHSLVSVTAGAPDGTIVVAGWQVVTGERGPLSQVLVIRLDRDGLLDRSFNDWGGVVVRDPSGGAYALAVEPDGAVIAAGFAVLVDTTTDAAEGLERLVETKHFAVVRCNADGSLDTTFGIDGVARIDLGGEEEWASAVMVQPTGHILLAGTSRAQDRGKFVVARLHGAAPRDAAATGR